MISFESVSEFFYDILGFRKPGIAVGAIRKTVKYGKVPRKPLRDNDWIDNSPNYHKDQGRVGSCACVTMCAQAEDIIINETRDRLSEIPWKPVWEQLKALNLASDKGGSHLLDNLWFGQTHGFLDLRGQRWKIDIIEKIDRSEIEKFIRMGYEVYTGAMCGYPMCDKNWLFRVGHRKFGHGFRKVGLNFRDKLNKRFLDETTWKRYGLKKSSQFYYPESETRRLMSCYVFTLKKVQE